MDNNPRLEVGHINRPKAGHKDCGTINASCLTCGKDLMVFQVTKSNSDLVKEGRDRIDTVARVMCLCGGQSENVTIGGVFFVGCADDNMAFDIVDDTSSEGIDVTYKAWVK